MTKPRGMSIKIDLSNATGSNCVYGFLKSWRRCERSERKMVR
jgi:hypothetical protein